MDNTNLLKIRLTVTLIFVLLIGFSITFTAFTTDITVAGSWSETINFNNLQGGAGSEIIGTCESIPGDVIIDISNGSPSWRVDLRRDGMNWPAELSLSVKRVSSGTGGSVSGGTGYQTITTTDQILFTGSGNITGIELQFQLDGISTSITPDIYNTQIIYTVVDL